MSDAVQQPPTVLVVEDEPLLRLFAVDMIEEAGFVVLQAANAAEAVFLLQEHDEIAIIFTDIDMPPGLDGVALAATVRDRWPPIDIIITSGKPFPTAAQLPERSVFFPKPYRQDQVIETLQRMAA